MRLLLKGTDHKYTLFCVWLYPACESGSGSIGADPSVDAAYCFCGIFADRSFLFQIFVKASAEVGRGF